MKRTLVIVAFVIWIISFLLSKQIYIEIIENNRINLPSNIRAGEQFHRFDGQVVSYDLAKNSMIFETLSPISQEKIRYKLYYKNIPDMMNELNQQNYHFSIVLDLNQNIFRSPKNHYGFDYDYYLFSQGIHGQFYVQDFEVIKQLDSCLHCSRLALREKVAVNLDSRYSTEVGAFLKAILLGDRSGMINYEEYKDMGLAHIFAISGLHFGLVYKLLQNVIRFPNRYIKSGMILMVLLVFSFWIGPSYSSYRAFALIVYMEVSRLFHKNPDVMTGVAFSSIVILMIRPVALLSQSFQLSFYAYFCVAVIYRTYFSDQTVTKTSKVLNSIRFSMVLQLLLMPATLFYFHKINIFGFIANFIIVPLIGLILPIALLDLLSTGLGIEFVSKVFSAVLSQLIGLMEKTISYLPSELYSPSWFRPEDYWILIAAFALFILLRSFYINNEKKRIVCYWAISVIATFSLLNTLPDDRVEIQFVDVGHGDFSVLRYNQRVILIDAGDGYMDCYDYLKDQGIVGIDAVILSHAHQDHIGGLEKLLNHYDIENVFVNQETYDVIKMNANLSDLVPIVVEHPNEITWNQVILDITPVKSITETNDNALIVKFDYMDRIGYFLGDVSESVLDMLQFEETIDFVKVPHHGSKTSISEAFYSGKFISNAIISHSTKYNMPSADVIDLMRSNGVNIFSTYYNGAIQLIFSDDSLSLSTYLNDNR